MNVGEDNREWEQDEDTGYDSRARASCEMRGGVSEEMTGHLHGAEEMGRAQSCTKNWGNYVLGGGTARVEASRQGCK